MKKSVLSIVILIIFSLASGISTIAQNTTSNSSNPFVHPLSPSPSDSVFIYYTYVSTDGCPDFYFQRDSSTIKELYLSLKKISNVGRICTQAITTFKAKLFLGFFKSDSKIFLDGKLIAEIKAKCTPDKEGVVVNCNGNLYIQEISPLTVMQLYLIQNSTTNVQLKLGDKVKFSGNRFNLSLNPYAPCSVVGEANCITLTNPAPVCVKDRKGIVVMCNRQLYIKEVTVSTDLISVREPKLFVFQNYNITDTSGTTKPALKLNDQVIFGAELIDNFANDSASVCQIAGKVKCFELVYILPDCELNREGIVVKCNNDLFIEEFSIAATAIKQFWAIKLNSNLLLKEGDRVKFGGHRIQLDSTNFTMPCRVIGVAQCANIIETPPPPCIADRKGIIVVCENNLYVKEINNITNSTDVYRLFAFENQTNADGSISRKFNVGDIVKFAPVFAAADNNKIGNCTVVGKAICLEIFSDIPDCVPNRKGKVINCNNQLYISEYTATNDLSTHLYAFMNNGNYETLKEGDIVAFGATVLTSASTTIFQQCKIIGTAICWKIIETTPECVLNRKGVIEQGIDGCTDNLYIREIETRKLFRISLLKASYDSNIAVAGLRPGYKVLFGGYLTGKDSNNVRLCETDGVAQCLKIVDTNIGCELNRKGIIVRGTGNCLNKVFVQDINTGSLYLLNNYDGIYRTDNYTAKLNPGDMISFGISEKDYSQNDSCKIAGVVLCYELISTAKTSVIAGYALTESGKLSSGRALLIHKPTRKVYAITKINEGYFEFKNVQKAAYTVYVIPTYPELLKFLPTFYVDKLYYRNADFFEVSEEKTEIFVKMLSHQPKIGTGRIFGNVHYESDILNDSLMMKNILGESFANVNFNLAVDVPVLLLDLKEQPITWTVTDIYGNYLFENIPIGAFRIFSETTTATGNQNVELTGDRSTVTVNMVMKSNVESTSIPEKIISEIAVYPVPAKDKLTVVLPSNEIISIFDIRGQMIFKQQGVTGMNKIDISNLNKGVLILKTGNNSIRIVKD